MALRVEKGHGILLPLLNFKQVILFPGFLLGLDRVIIAPLARINHIALILPKQVQNQFHTISYPTQVALDVWHHSSLLRKTKFPKIALPKV